MTKFDKLCESLISEIDWRKLANAAPGQAISALGKATGAIGYGLGAGGKAIPGTAAASSALQQAGAAISKFSTGQVDKARQAQSEKIAQQLGISTKQAPKANETVSITLGRFAGRGLGVNVKTALLQKPASYEGGQLYTVPMRGVKAGDKDIASIKALYNPAGQGAAQVFYFDKNNMPIQNPAEFGLPRTALLKPNPDRDVSNWILTDRLTAEPEELNVKITKGATVRKGTVMPITGREGKVVQYKILTDPDAEGNFIALRV